MSLQFLWWNYYIPIYNEKSNLWLKDELEIQFPLALV